MEVRNILVDKYTKGELSRIKYIVLHYTGNPGTSAEANATYFKNTTKKVSSHYVVDSKEIIRCVDDKNVAWHCGSSSGVYKHSECRNSNSIGIEICCDKKNRTSVKASDKDWFFEEKTLELVKGLVVSLMLTYNIPISNVIRHYDVTGKHCPAMWVSSKDEYDKFMNELSTEFACAKLEDNQSNNSNDQGDKSNDPEVIKDVDKYIWDKLIEAGCGEYGAAGVMGNLYAESGLRANNLQKVYEKKLGLTDTEYTDMVDSGKYTDEKFINDKAGYGLAQWTYWSRKQALLNHIRKLGVSIGSVSGQVSFLVDELNSYKLVGQLRKCISVEEASTLILTKYEKPANQDDIVKAKRAEYSKKYYDRFSCKDSNDNKLEQVEFKPYLVKVLADALNYRKGPGVNYGINGVIRDRGIYTIITESNGWGKLKSGVGWINLSYTKKVK